jgi:hypothetical protein
MKLYVLHIAVERAGAVYDPAIIRVLKAERAAA